MMYRLTVAVLLAVTVLSTANLHASVITFAHLAKEAPGLKVQGIRVTLTGPDQSRVPILFYGSDMGMWGITTAPSLTNLADSKAYSGTVRLTQAVQTVTFSVQNDNAFWNSRIFINAFYNKHRVKSLNVQLLPLGKVTQITITAPNIDKVNWHGSNWVFQPFTVQSLTLAAAQTSSVPPDGGSTVGTGVPEPASSGILLIVLICCLLVWRKSTMPPRRRPSAAE